MWFYSGTKVLDPQMLRGLWVQKKFFKKKHPYWCKICRKKEPGPLKGYLAKFEFNSSDFLGMERLTTPPPPQVSNSLELFSTITAGFVLTFLEISSITWFFRLPILIWCNLDGRSHGCNQHWHGWWPAMSAYDQTTSIGEWIVFTNQIKNHNIIYDIECILLKFS